MIKVYQTIVDKGRGNCLQAAVASLFEVGLSDVPHFIEHKDWYTRMAKFYSSKGNYEIMCLNPNGYLEMTREILEHDMGINGYWCASVPSQTFENSTHAVIIDRDLNIVHDPNPNQKALELNYKDILDIDVVKDDWYIDVNGKLKIISKKSDIRR